MGQSGFEILRNSTLDKDMTQLLVVIEDINEHFSDFS